MKFMKKKVILSWSADVMYYNKVNRNEIIADSEANFFQSSLVAIRLFSQGTVLWQNLSSEFVLYCHPIRIRFTKETNNITKEEIDYIEQKCARLFPSRYYFECFEESIQIKHTLFLTLVDAKICNAATETTCTMRCYMSNQTSADCRSKP